MVKVVLSLILICCMLSVALKTERYYTIIMFLTDTPCHKLAVAETVSLLLKQPNTLLVSILHIVIILMVHLLQSGEEIHSLFLNSVLKAKGPEHVCSAARLCSASFTAWQ